MRRPTVLKALARALRTGAVALLVLGGAAAPPAFDREPPTPIESEEGKVVLTWSWPTSPPDRPVEFEVQGAATPGFAAARVLYEGPDRATVITGLLEGTYFYRVRAITGKDDFTPWSEPLEVQVDYPNRQTVGWLIGLGLVVFLATVTAVGVGHRRVAGGGSGS